MTAQACAQPRAISAVLNARAVWFFGRQRIQFSTSTTLSSGHSKWATIKHDKAKNDAFRCKQRFALGNDISAAVKRMGADPGVNPQLADAIARAKKAGLPKAGIEAAVARGEGKSLSGAPLETILIEAVIPPVSMIIEALTDSKGRTKQNVRIALKHTNGQIGPTMYLFEKRGRLVLGRNRHVDGDAIFEKALETGALDVNESKDEFVIDTDPTALKEMETAMQESFKLNVESSESIWVPNSETMVSEVEEETLENWNKFQTMLDDIPEIKAVYTNLDQPEDVDVAK